MRISGTNVGFPLIHLDVVFCPPDTQGIMLSVYVWFDIGERTKRIDTTFTASIGIVCIGCSLFRFFYLSADLLACIQKPTWPAPFYRRFTKYLYLRYHMTMPYPAYMVPPINPRYTSPAKRLPGPRLPGSPVLYPRE